jgi:hypothetical protein
MDTTISMNIKLMWMILLVMLPGCLGRRLQYFPRMDTNKIFHQQKEGLNVTIGKFDASASRSYFGTDLTYYGYVPLHLHVSNSSNSPYILKTGEVELPLAPSKKVMDLLYHDVRSFTLWTTIPAVIFAWPLLAVTVPIACGLWYDNKKITENLTEKTLKKNETIEIRPYESMDRLIFAYVEDLPSHANISFMKKKTESWLTFYVDLTQEPSLQRS